MSHSLTSCDKILFLGHSNKVIEVELGRKKKSSIKPKKLSLKKKTLIKSINKKSNEIDNFIVNLSACVNDRLNASVLTIIFPEVEQSKRPNAKTAKEVIKT